MSREGRRRTLRVLVVDDSAASRDELVRLLHGGDGLVVAGTAADGEQGLAEALRLEPDVVVLDLQMPRMDGFTFLRLLMARRPTPVVVLSSRSRRADVFKALELGALDFVARPERGGLAPVREELLEKCATVRALRIQNLSAGARALDARELEPARVAVVGASTGGPSALQRLLAALPGELPLAVLVAQHMPERFTGAFAERLARGSHFSVVEAVDGDLVVAGRALVAPGGHHLELARGADGVLRAAVLPPGAPGPGARHCPSIDRLFRSAARMLGRRACAALLTGMGTDGRDGIAAVKAAGGLTLAESEETAVVYGMPQAAAETGAVDALLGLDALTARLVEFARDARAP
ncbi:chemotaxis-specific protein-glutamate methyltransferase CheB [Anaeromyxobacter dehalogenans]|uniref:Protein-glutamate methylesterase/protein-glutamine glutaminase 6 n=1 Tax=Anaeromyxobacter dehalogenans (strain 2CP-C) TaxID=290397 RepID=CHEB6_ANADE|nr:chemotaxis-specific protein-glutamate methyltransferase CheB [Anaeromyxobacter dehalogenans]Q2ILG8.1 RecName: Full=Protein-glutamate methylesterase/protein-glutamine glutaminase 6 [Anaeromyxobacter dehalogenans 2CP-C]ABC82500.1 response regulator receiver (CheY-like) modulated CheB methylesterase [Anaeromyxobacter dehalogenans 2CP-C]